MNSICGYLTINLCDSYLLIIEVITYKHEFLYDSNVQIIDHLQA